MWYNSVLASSNCQAGTERIDPTAAGISVRCWYQRWYLDWSARRPWVWTKTNRVKQNQQWAKGLSISWFAYFFLPLPSSWLTKGSRKLLTTDDKANKDAKIWSVDQIELFQLYNYKPSIRSNTSPFRDRLGSVVSRGKTQAPPTLSYKFRRTLFATWGDDAPMQPAQPRYSN